MSEKQLGYDVYEDDRSFEQDGLTGNVKKYAIDKMSFPCFILMADQEHPVPMYKIKVLKQMSGSIKIYDEDEANMAIDIYFNQNNQTISICKIFPKQVKSFLKLFEGTLIDGYLNKETQLTGNYLYVLSD